MADTQFQSMVTDQLTQIAKDLTALKSFSEDSITKLGEKVDSLEGKVDGLEGRMESLEGKVDGLEGKMESLEGKVDGLEGSVESLTGFVAEQRETNKRLEKSHDELIFLVQHEVIEQLGGISDKLAQYTDHKIQEHEERFHGGRLVAA